MQSLDLVVVCQSPMSSMRKLYFLFILLAIPLLSRAEATAFDINNNGILDSQEQEVVLESSFLLPAGVYTFNNLVISNNASLTALSDVNSLSTFKGVKIIANNLTISSGSTINADGKGYGNSSGPGSGGQNFYNFGASYGGVGINNIATSTYGSATAPLDLGSGSAYPGGGAIQIEILNNLINNGTVSANGQNSGSGGSLYIKSKNISGAGVFSANGGNIFASGYFAGPGGGGRVAIYYQNSTFNGVVEVKGGCGSYDGWSQTCAERGSAGLFDTTNDNLHITSSWQFLKNDGPFDLNKIIVSGTSKVKSINDTQINANELVLSGSSSMDVFGNSTFIVEKISISDGSTLNMAGDGKLKVLDLSLTGNSNLTTGVLKVLDIEAENVFISSDSKINVDSRGYGPHSGPGAPTNYNAFYETYLDGASYGGVGDSNSLSSTYGSSTAPTDFGSGGDGLYAYGGGALRMNVTNDFANEGTISAIGGLTSSGGSIYVTAKNLSGDGLFTARGGGAYCPNTCFRPGGGGRVAVYYESSTFSGTTDVLGGGCRFCWGGQGGEGTVVLQKYFPNTVTPKTGTSIMFFPGVMGSRLYEAGDEKWVSRSDSKHARLTLDTNGKSLNQIYTKDDTQSINDEPETGIVDEASFGVNIYNSFINDLRNWKIDGTVTDYAFIPYDWRLSLEDIITNGATSSPDKLSYIGTQVFSESYILKKLTELGSISEKIVLIGHSNGGLVIKALTQKLRETNNPLYNQIDKIIFIAVPQVGTPEAVLNLLHGTSLGQGLVMSNQRARQLSENMPAVYNLLPSAGYFSTVLPGYTVDKVVSFENNPIYDPQLSQYGVFVSNSTELRNFVLGSDGRAKPAYLDTDSPNIGNTGLYADTEAMHAILDSWQPASTTRVIQVGGWGEETLAGINYKTCQNQSSPVPYKCFKPQFVIDGDGTVVVPSALWMSTSSPNVERWWVDLGQYNKSRPTILKTKHADILEISNLTEFVKSRVMNQNFTDDIVVNSDSTLISGDTRLHFTLHSPLTLGVTDALGRYTGQDPITNEIIEEIPNVDFRVIGGTQFLSIPSDMVGQVKLKGYENGVFALDIDKQQGNSVIESTSFQGIPTSTTTVVTLNINNLVASSTMNIDSNGDGTVDLLLYAKLGEIVTPPKYKWNGFFQPINDTNFYTTEKLSVFKGGSTIPVKFQLKDAFGTIVQASTTPVWLAPQKGGVLTASIGESVYSDSGTSGNMFKWDSESQEYHYNWKTKGFATGFWYKLSVKLDDGNVYSVVVGLR